MLEKKEMPMSRVQTNKKVREWVKKGMEGGVNKERAREKGEGSREGNGRTKEGAKRGKRRSRTHNEGE